MAAFKHIVLDTNAFVNGATLGGIADHYWTVEEVLAEVRDARARHVLDTLPFKLETRIPADSSIAAVRAFAAKTGDLSRLSTVDILVLALAHQIEKEANGTRFIRAEPPKFETQHGLIHARPVADCKFFNTAGGCREGDACKFRHVSAAAAVDAGAADETGVAATPLNSSVVVASVSAPVTAASGTAPTASTTSAEVAAPTADASATTSAATAPGGSAVRKPGLSFAAMARKGLDSSPSTAVPAPAPAPAPTPAPVASSATSSASAGTAKATGSAAVSLSASTAAAASSPVAGAARSASAGGSGVAASATSVVAGLSGGAAGGAASSSSPVATAGSSSRSKASAAVAGSSSDSGSAASAAVADDDDGWETVPAASHHHQRHGGKGAGKGKGKGASTSTTGSKAAPAPAPVPAVSSTVASGDLGASVAASGGAGVTAATSASASGLAGTDFFSAPVDVALAAALADCDDGDGDDDGEDGHAAAAGAIGGGGFDAISSGNDAMLTSADYDEDAGEWILPSAPPSSTLSTADGATGAASVHGGAGASSVHDAASLISGATSYPFGYERIATSRGVGDEAKDLPPDRVLVACLTSDFAMQNVLLQMGINLASGGGKLIRSLKQWVLKCDACFTISTEMGRLFCPRCGNATLARLGVTIAADGTPRYHYKADRKVSTRGTQYALPAARGGRNGDILLREDQLLTGIWAQRARMKVTETSMFAERAPGVADDPTLGLTRVLGGGAGLVVGLGKKNPNEARKKRR